MDKLLERDFVDQWTNYGTGKCKSGGEMLGLFLWSTYTLKKHVFVSHASLLAKLLTNMDS